jgi:hypothetical protein
VLETASVSGQASEEGDEVSAEIQPVEIVLDRDHAFEKKPARGRGCAVCGDAKTARQHFGAPPSLNVLGSGNVFAFQAIKKSLMAALIEGLELADLQRPVARVLVEGECTFPDRKKRDQGNHRALLEKALGDALVEGGWLADDTWEQYEFGNLSATYERGVSRLRLVIFPTALELAA